MDFPFLHHYTIICLIFLLIPLFININVSSQAQQQLLLSSPPPPPNVNITLGSSLTAENGNNSSSWTSPSGDFAFGFIQPPPGGGGGGYLLAIWFNKIPEKTVIWSANRDNLAPEGSTLQLVEDGRFVLNNPTGQNIWNADTGGGVVAYGVMLDTGNFVLAGNTSSSSFLWQSFNNPTDTLLPSQMLTVGQNIVSNFSVTNYSSGRFQLNMQSDGNLFLYTRHYPLDALNSPYWSTRSSGSNFRFVFNQTAGLVDINGSLINSVFPNPLSVNQYYQRLTLDYDGVLRRYVYPKSSSTSSTDGSPMAWSISDSLPSNICLSIRQDTGGGVCGYNSLCLLGSDQKPVCQCPPGYSLIDTNDSMGGCKPDFVPQSCDNETSHFVYTDMPNADWPLSDYEHFQPVREDWCRQVCLSDCFCTVAIFRGTDCWKKKLPLSNGRIDSSVGGKALIKVRQGGISTTYPDNFNPKSNPNRWKVIIIVGSVLLGSSLLVNMLVLLKNLFFNKNAYTLVPANPVLPGLNIRSFSYHELKEATNGFKEELGSGAYSVVFKGTLKNQSDQLVAVKRLHNMANEGEKEFNAEVSSISKTNHKNLVQLLGYCNEGNHRILVYEFMSNGSLASFLFDNQRPDWYKRVEIATTTARGLCYLHEECSSQIIHCDIKPQNVLLNGCLTAKISDFGLAKLLNHDQTKTMTNIRGTRGYLAPEWFRNMAITSKVDVYSFGILLLELVCCRKNINTDVEEEIEVILSDWAYDCYDEKNLHLLIEYDEEALNDLNRVEKCVSIALWCIQEDPNLRPSMKKVVQMLEGSILVPVPPNPSFFNSSIS